MDKIDTKIKSQDEFVYIMVIYESLPYSDIAFKRNDNRKTQRTKNVDCPYCGRIFETVEAKTKVEIYRCSKKAKVDCHALRHCKVCHGFVGVKYA